MRDTLEMAREVYGAHTEWNEAQLERLNALVELIRADEREACGKIIESKIEQVRLWNNETYLVECLTAIRARGNK